MSNQLTRLTLAALALGPMGLAFNEAVDRVEQSCKIDYDLAGKRTITIKISIEPKGSLGGQTAAFIEHTVTTALPKRATRTVGIISTQGEVGINVDSLDARQPNLFDIPAEDEHTTAPEGAETITEEA